MLDHDKVLHILAYALISFFAFLSIDPGKKYCAWILVLVVLFLVAAIDEITQPLFGRTFSFYDYLANIVAVFVLFVNFVDHRQLSS